MLRGRVVRDEVEQHADAARVGLVEEPVEIGQGPEERIDVPIVGDVIPEVGHR